MSSPRTGPRPERPVLVVGSALEDVLVTVLGLPAHGGHTWAQPVAQGNGGTGLNVLRATAALGCTPLSALAVGGEQGQAGAVVGRVEGQEGGGAVGQG
ncbi:hypothetical protein, partial [Actinomyces sp. 187325]|uniref:hypothetical protein n=1 Tax=Actinomyces sp. 187325 TaxID=2927828 RepID=UPI0020174A96